MNLKEFKEKIGEDFKAFERNLKVENVTVKMHLKACKDLGIASWWEIIGNGFYWSDTKEGFDYWEKVASKHAV